MKIEEAKELIADLERFEQCAVFSGGVNTVKDIDRAKRVKEAYEAHVLREFGCLLKVLKTVSKFEKFDGPKCEALHLFIEKVSEVEGI